MLLRGEFMRSDGPVIPNNVTTVGAQTILGAALRNTVPVLWVGLCSGGLCARSSDRRAAEPDYWTNGYARLPVTRDNVGWPTTGVVNGEVYFRDSRTDLGSRLAASVRQTNHSYVHLWNSEWSRR
jgi:hypothetical protein